MHINVISGLLLLIVNKIKCDINISSENILGVQETVTSNERFPYVAAILRKSKYISAGALIDEYWVLTAADSLYLIRESLRLLRIRLGSASYKSGGSLRHAKYVQIHPYFEDKKPQYDVALIRLSEGIALNPNLNPIQLQTRKSVPSKLPLLVTAWKIFNINSKNGTSIKNHQYLSVSHYRPLESEECSDQLEAIDSNRTDDILCLDLPIGVDPCQRDIGAPVTMNGVLWGIVSSWKSEDCDLEQEPMFVNLVSPVEISSWIHSTIRSHRWSKKHTIDYEDNFF